MIDGFCKADAEMQSQHNNAIVLKFFFEKEASGERGGRLPGSYSRVHNEFVYFKELNLLLSKLEAIFKSIFLILIV